MRFFLKNKIYIIIITLIFLFFLFLLKENFQSKFSIIDDHEVINNVLRIKKISFIPNYIELIKDDIINSRFRLSYWFLRNIEFLLFGYNHFFYYLFHFISITTGFILLYLTFFYFFKKNFILSILTILLISLNPLWSDIYTRLAPNERYSFFFLSIWFFLLRLILESKKISFSKNLLFLLSVFLVSFSKENFLIFIPISFLLQIFFVVKKSPSKFVITFSFFYFLLITLITFLFVFKIKSTGLDVYGRPTSFLFRFLVIKNNLKDIVFNYGLIESFFWLTFALFSKKNFNLIIGIFNIVLFIMILVFNYFINLGQFLAARYFFPISVVKFYFLPIFYFLSHDNKSKKISFNLKFINILLFIYLIINFIFVYQNFYTFQDSIKNKNTWTFNFNHYLDKIIDINKNQGIKNIIFIYEAPYYEQMFSTMTFLNYKNFIGRKYVLLPYSCTQYQNSSLEKKLCEILIKNKKKFQGIYKFELININKLNQIQGACLMISSSSQNLMDKCKKIINYF